MNREIPDVPLDKQLDRVTEQLIQDFVDRIDSRAIQQEVERVASSLADARVTQYVPVLVTRAVRDRFGRSD